MEIRLLGPVELYSARGPVPISSAKQRALLAFLALHPQRLVTYDVLIDGLWGHDPPDATVQALRFHVSRLRGILRRADDADRLRTRPGGYQLVIAEDAVDVLRFERTIAGARLARSEGAAPDTVSRAFRDALDLWVGPALADVNGEPFVVGERRRLEELRLAATEDYLAAELAAARHADAVGELERMVDRHPSGSGSGSSSSRRCTGRAAKRTPSRPTSGYAGSSPMRSASSRPHHCGNSNTTSSSKTQALPHPRRARGPAPIRATNS
jgi:DNA-binding SARP family transcriptional activator